MIKLCVRMLYKCHFTNNSVPNFLVCLFLLDILLQCPLLTHCTQQGPEADASEAGGHTHSSSASGGDDKTDKPVKGSMSQLEIYQKLFAKKRESHREAVRSIVSLDNFDKQYKMIKLVLEKLFTVLSESKVKLMEAGFSPGDPFPDSLTTREALSQVAENTAFFGDLRLRLPDITEKILKLNKEWELTATWGIGFCSDSKILEGPDSKMLNLVEQEMNIVVRSPNYVNPYRQNVEMEKQTEREVDALLQEKLKEMKRIQEKREKREKRKRGPRLSGVPRQEL